MAARININKEQFFEFYPELLNSLLKDQTLSKGKEQVNIFWATDCYANLGKGYQYFDRITVEAISGTNGSIIVPRALKSREQQMQRSRMMAEVFTPSWVCNKQNNLIDNAWFGREDVFNKEMDFPDGNHSWAINTNTILFPENKSWIDYITENRLEITCGEAPYLVSRYDTVTGETIPVQYRIGILDRKLRIVNENTKSEEDWISAAQKAYMSTYGYEWQGDNLILAREALLLTFVEYFQEKFNKDPNTNLLHDITNIITWNIWQMDGLKGVIPDSCHEEQVITNVLFGEPEIEIKRCAGCKNNDIKSHNGIQCNIMDWETRQPIKFSSLFSK